MSLNPKFLIHLRQRVRAFRLRGLGVVAGRGLILGPAIVIRGGRDLEGKSRISLDAACELQAGVVLDTGGGRIAIGRETYVGPYSVLYGHGSLTVGSHTLIGPHCRLVTSNHTVPPIGRLIRYEPDILLPTVIGSDVWLGSGVTVLGGVTIGDGCVVGAGAVVTRDLPPHSIAHGVPAKVQGYRLRP
jgi:acetyltransferase-like isoleucine patch superfamily enzyme